MKNSAIKVTSLTHLKRICEGKNEPLEFRLALNGGCYSRKSIIYPYPSGGSCGKLWAVTHHIDETEEILTDDELMTETNIGEGIKKGAFYYMKERK